MSNLTAVPPTRKATAQAPAAYGRQVELDWLRSLIVLGIVPMHVMMIFAATTTIFVKSSVASPELGYVANFVAAWGIPVIFLMSGAGAKFAVEHRTGPAFVRERLLHLGIPLLLIALVFAPLQAYFILLSNPSLINMSAEYGFTLTTANPEQLRNIPAFYQEYLTYLVTSVRQLSPAVGNFVFGGLFFVPRLLVISFICLPFFLYLRRRGQRWIERIATIGANPIALLIGAGLIPGVLLAILRSGWLERLTINWPYTEDWSTFAIDLAMFVYGFLIYSSVRLRTAVRDVAFYAAGLGVLCTIAVVAVMALNRVPPNDYSPASIAYALGLAFSAWLPALALLGIAMRYLTKSNAWLLYLTPAAFPVFVLHTPLQAISAYYVLQLPIYWAIQLALIIIITMGLAFAAYEYVLKRTHVTRLLFGIKAPAKGG